MKRVTGIGGIFFKAKDPSALQAWYKRHLGIDVQAWGGAAFTWADGDGKPMAGTTAWSIFPADGDQFAPGTASFMVNYRVDDLHALVKALRDEGCNVLEKIDDSEYGKFAWVMDPGIGIPIGHLPQRGQCGCRFPPPAFPARHTPLRARSRTDRRDGERENPPVQGNSRPGRGRRRSRPRSGRRLRCRAARG